MRGPEARGVPCKGRAGGQGQEPGQWSCGVPPAAPGELWDSAGSAAPPRALAAWRLPMAGASILTTRPVTDSPPSLIAKLLALAADQELVYDLWKISMKRPRPFLWACHHHHPRSYVPSLCTPKPPWSSPGLPSCLDITKVSVRLQRPGHCTDPGSATVGRKHFVFWIILYFV